MIDKNYESMIIGHVTMDTNTDHLGNTVRAAGGAVLFSSAAAHSLGHKVCVLTKMNPAEQDRLSAFTIPEENLVCLPSKRSTNMENTYFTADKERRRSVCTSQGDAFSIDDVPEEISAGIYHLAGLVVGDYANDLIPALSRRGSVAVDVQGYLRNVDHANGGAMFFADWKEKKAMLPYIRFLKTDAAEAEILTGETDRAAAAKQLYQWGAKEILITHNTEVLIYDGEDILTCPIRARNLSGRTGRGDTTFACYINERLQHTPKEALMLATAAVSKKMESPGPLNCTRTDIEKYFDDFYPDFH